MWLPNSDSYGNIYYVHSVTGETSWDPADDTTEYPKDNGEDYVDSQATTDIEVVDEYWEEIVEEDGSVYYMNQVTGEKRWEMPGMPLVSSSFYDLASPTSQLSPADLESVMATETLATSFERDPNTDIARNEIAKRLTEKVIEKAGKLSMRKMERLRIKKDKSLNEAKRLSAKSAARASKMNLVPQEGHPDYEAYVRRIEKEAREKADILEQLEKAVDRVDQHGNVLKKYSSGVAAADELGLRPAQLLKHLNGATSSCQGHIFRYHGADGFQMSAVELQDRLEGVQFEPLHKTKQTELPIEKILTALGDWKGPKLARLRRIDLSFEAIGDEGALLLAPGLEKSSVVSVLLVSSGVGDEGICALAEAFRRNSSLTELVVNNNLITDKGIELLAQCLTGSSIRKLNLSVNPFKDRGALALATMLISPLCQLQTLILGGCSSPKESFAGGSSDADVKNGLAPKGEVSRIGPEGTALIAAALLAPHGCPLQRLWLINCDIGTVGCRGISAALYSRITLAEVNISGNLLKPADQRILIDAATENRSLKALICSDCGLNEANQEQLRVAMRHDLPTRSWKEEAAIAGVASSLRLELLELARTKGIVFQEPPQPPSTLISHPRISKPLDEPIWKKKIDSDWNNSDIEMLLGDPLPIGEGFAVLNRLRSSLQEAKLKIERQAGESKDRTEKLAVGLESSLRVLAELKERKKLLAQKWSQKITDATKKFRQCELNVEKAEKLLEESKHRISDFETELISLRDLVIEFDKTTSSQGKPADAQKAAARAAAKVCEDRLFSLRNEQPLLETGLAKANGLFDEARAALDDTFKIALRESSASQIEVDRLEAETKKDSADLLIFADSEGPSAILHSRFSEYVRALDVYAEVAQASEEAHILVSNTCGDSQVDNNLKEAIRIQRVRGNILKDARDLLGKHQLTIQSPFVTNATRRNIQESVLMAKEDILSNEVLYRTCEQNTKRRIIEFQAVAFQYSKEMESKPIDGQHFRAKKLLDGLHTASVIESAMTSLAPQPSLQDARLRRVSSNAVDSGTQSFRGQPRRSTALGNQAVDSGISTNFDAFSQDTTRILDALSIPRKVPPNRSPRPFDEIRQAQIMDEIVAGISDLGSSQLRGELELRGVEDVNEMNHEKLIQKLAQIKSSPPLQLSLT